MNLVYFYLKNNDCYKANRWIKPEGIMVHSTGANNPMLKRYVPLENGYSSMHWDRQDVDKCVHAFIGKRNDGSIATCQTLPWEMRGWHAGGAANNTHIGFEICETNLDDVVFFEKIYSEAIELCAFLCIEFDISPNLIICHSEGNSLGIASNHADIMHWLPRHDKDMDDFRFDVQSLIDSQSEWRAELASAKVFCEEVGLLNGDGQSLNWNEDLTREELAQVLQRLSYG